ncbi:MAG: hypothetical protein KA267_06025 [Gemmatimonadales bacterium]|nr:hypothetical protein [Gemmatimonadales bacterium]
MASVRELFVRAQTILQDKTGIRWPLAELRLWANDALREVVTLKPSANVRAMTITLDTGTRQTLPTSAIQMVRAIRNMSSANPDTAVGGRAIITVPREVMDSQNPDWHDPSIFPPQKEVIHVIYDPEDQRSFYVWPPNDATGRIEVAVARYPAEIPSSPTPELRHSYTTLIDLSDIYFNALVDYILYRAYLKDNEVSGNAERAQAHYAAFANSLGVKVQNEIKSNPNTTAAATGLAT